MVGRHLVGFVIVTVIGLPASRADPTRDAFFDDLVGGKPLRVVPPPPARPGIPAISVRVYGPTDRGKWFTYVTSGMSDQPMRLERGVPKKLARAELILYASKDEPRLVKLLQSVSAWVFQSKTWVGHGHTVSDLALLALADAALLRRLASDGEAHKDPAVSKRLLLGMRHVLLMSSLLAEHRRKAASLKVSSAPVELLMVQAISEAERSVKVSYGLKRLFQVLDRQGVTHLVDPTRRTRLPEGGRKPDARGERTR